MSDRVLLDPALAPALAAEGLAEADGLFRLGGAPETRHLVTTIEIPLPGTVGLFHLKRYHYAGWRRAKGLVGRGTLFGPAPEVNEFRALTRLREMGLPAVRPVAAASRRRGGRLVAHALLTEHVPDAVDLACRLDTPGDPVREDADLRRRSLDRLAAHLARMQAEGFVHGDCYARNVLVRLEQAEDGTFDPHLLFLDCRRGGGSAWRRGALFDVATLDGSLVGRVPATDRLRALRAFLPEGAPTRRMHERIAGRRERLLARDARRGRARR